MPEENDIKILRNYFMKHYEKKYLDIFDDAFAQNKKRFSINKYWNILYI